MPPRDLSRSLQRTLTHLLPPAKRGGKFQAPIPTHFRPSPRFVQVKDRVPFWNIAPGDKVVLIKGDERIKGKKGTVSIVDRETNRVALKESVFQTIKRQPSTYPGEALSKSFTGSDSTVNLTKWYHLSNLRLSIVAPNPVSGQEESYTVSRMRRTAPSWNKKLGKFHWIRMGFVSKLARGEENGWRMIPWPKETPVEKGTPGPLDAPSSLSLSDTFSPTLTSLSLATLALHAPSTSPSPNAPLGSSHVAEAPPPELKISPIDLSGGRWTRAKRTKRWNERREEEREERRLGGRRGEEVL